jgi:hypothetical protein
VSPIELSHECCRKRAEQIATANALRASLISDDRRKNPYPMKRLHLLGILIIAVLLSACGSLEKKAVLINPGDTKEQVLAIMGPPGDRQFRGKDEAWQYGQTGAGFGYHDFRIVWFYDGKVTGLTSYKDHTPASSAASHFKPIRWEDAPDRTVEVRVR